VVSLAQQPNKRFVAAEEIGAMTVFLVGDHGASLTSAAIAIDGREVHSDGGAHPHRVAHNRFESC